MLSGNSEKSHAFKKNQGMARRICRNVWEDQEERLHIKTQSTYIINNILYSPIGFF